MCWECDHPDAGHQGYIEHLRGMIDQYGWAVQGVGPDRVHPPWAYTVGLTAHGRPELAVTGMSITDAAGLLNDVAAHCMHAAVPEPGEQIPLIGARSLSSWRSTCRRRTCWLPWSSSAR
jgi:hypothetical protein